MRLNLDMNIFAGVNSGRAAQTDLFGRTVRNANAGPASLLSGSFDPIEQKRAMVRKQAFKVVGDTFASDRKLDGEFTEREDKMAHYKNVIGESQKRIREFNEMKEQLREEYGVDSDSQEQEDLELLERYQNKESRMSMTMEEWDRVAEIEKNGLTDYQKRALDIDLYKEPFEEALKDAKKGYLEENATLRAMTLERLKKDPMVEASKEADQILKDGSKEIIGMLQEEAIDHIDEKFEEEIEEAEERKEEEKQEQEKLEEAKERREELEALTNPEKAEKEHSRESESDVLSADPLTESILKMDGIKSDVQKEVSEMMTKMKLVAEDLKGIKVDQLI
ncbi:MAG: hypothetical protein K2N87_15760 [Eubacterium sp.]|nr:hypothetical protein [Eubacterium sp.]